MKKIIPVAALLAAISLTSCGGHSQASREQISNAHERAAKMLNEKHQTPAKQDKSDAIAVEADSTTNK